MALFLSKAIITTESPRVHQENLNETKTTLKKEIMSDLSKILAENQREVSKLKAPVVKKQSNIQNLGNSDTENEIALPQLHRPSKKIKRLLPTTLH